MPIDYTPLQEGQALNAASLIDIKNGFENSINDLKAEDIEHTALTAEHLPTIASAHSYMEHSGTSHSYTNQYPTWAVVDNGSVALEITGLDIDLLTPTNNNYARGAFVLANIALRRVYDNSTGSAVLGLFFAVFQIQYQINGVTWQDVDKSRRWVSCDKGPQAGNHGANGPMDIDVSLRTFIRREDTTGSDVITGVRVQVAAAMNGTTYTPTATVEVVLQEGNISVIAVRGETS